MSDVGYFSTLQRKRNKSCRKKKKIVTKLQGRVMIRNFVPSTANLTQSTCRVNTLAMTLMLRMILRMTVIRMTRNVSHLTCPPRKSLLGSKEHRTSCCKRCGRMSIPARSGLSFTAASKVRSRKRRWTTCGRINSPSAPRSSFDTVAQVVGNASSRSHLARLLGLRVL